MRCLIAVVTDTNCLFGPCLAKKITTPKVFVCTMHLFRFLSIYNGQKHASALANKCMVQTLGAVIFSPNIGDKICLGTNTDDKKTATE